MLIYAIISLTVVVATYWKALIVWAQYEEVSALLNFTFLTFYTMTCILYFVVCAFFGFHLYLVYNAHTTIEYCEKKRSNLELHRTPSPYKFTLYEN